MIYEIKALNCWKGDSFADSYRYTTLGFTDNKALANKLKELVIDPDIAKTFDWPLYHMGGWNIFQVEEVKLSDENFFVDFANDINNLFDPD